MAGLEGTEKGRGCHCFWDIPGRLREAEEDGKAQLSLEMGMELGKGNEEGKRVVQRVGPVQAKT